MQSDLVLRGPQQAAVFALLKDGKARDVATLYKAGWPEGTITDPRIQHQYVGSVVQALNKKLKARELRIYPLARAKRFYVLYAII